MTHAPQRLAVAALAGLALAGCLPAKPKSPVTPGPAVDLSGVSFVGTPLGATTQAAPAVSADDVGFDVTWIALEKMPPDVLAPLDALSTLTSSPLAGEPILTTGQQTRQARFGTGDSARELLDSIALRKTGGARQVGHQVGVVGPGVTTRFRCDVGPAGRSQSVVLTLSRPKDAAATASRPVATQAATTPAPATTSASIEPAASRPAVLGSLTVGLRGFAADPVDITPINAVESAFLDGLSLTPGEAIALLVPCRFEGQPFTVLLAYIEVTTADAARVAATQPADSGTASTRPADRTSLQSAVNALAGRGDLRPPLLYLASATGAKITTDAALVAGPPMLERLRDDISKAYAATAATADTAALGWAIDRATLLALAAEAEKGTLSPELAAVLVVHAGEVGRHPDGVAEIAKAVGNQVDWQARLIGENFIALEDNSPSARVRAFDWLTTLGRAPAGYDPLASARARRAAINRALEPTGGPR